jgi:hypothetical protein
MKAKAKSLLRDPIKLDMAQPVAAPPNRINVWTCQKCCGYTVCIDIHEGVTPFMIGCRASGREGDCDGMAYSNFYRVTRDFGTPQWEWFKPVGSEYRKLNRDMREHIDRGGLDIRKISYQPDFGDICA